MYRYTSGADDSDLFFASIHLADDGTSTGIEFYPGTGAVDDLHANVVNVCVPPMWNGQAGSGKAVRPSPVGTRNRVATKRNRDDDLDGSGAGLAAAKAAAEAAAAGLALFTLFCSQNTNLMTGPVM